MTTGTARVPDPVRRPLLSLATLTPDELAAVVTAAHHYGTDPDRWTDRLAGARVAFIFTAPAPSARSSFWSAATRLGCHTMHFGASGLQAAARETWVDTGMRLAPYVDAAVVRTNGPQTELEALASELPATINAATHREHPTKAIADACALLDHFGRTTALRLAYLGEAGNTARSLAHLVTGTPEMRLDVYCPKGYGFPPEELEALNGRRTDGDPIRQFDELPRRPDPVDAVYAARWQSRGLPHDDPGREEHFAPFHVNRETMASFSGDTAAVLLHDLPAVPGGQVESDVLRGPLSLADRQAYHEASAAAAALQWVLPAPAPVG
ncbi:ornithine carbamoyltransferase [Amycolatopsis sp. NPDC051903]|uniref:ornithine carbamoyltransferase n=1 Tax=Amycolatopsis sp. NPDC051903 TaxID=3363936 RepID=UPI0037AEE6C3